MRRYAVGITGASGVVYGRRVVQALLGQGHQVDLIITPAGRQVLAHELDLPASAGAVATAASFAPGPWDGGSGLLVLHDPADLHADISSGSVSLDGLAVVPCSMDTVSALATGRSENLLERVGDVALKEGRRLVVVPRETPLSRIHLRNLLALAEAGAVVLPAMPAFYQRPGRVEDMVDFVAGKVLNALGLRQDLFTPWPGNPGGA